MENQENQESTVTYNDVDLARALRSSDEQIRSSLALAIECEEAAHNEAHKNWQTELKKVQAEITEIEAFNAQNPASEKPLPVLPIEPVIDLNKRRGCYFVEFEDVDHELSEENAPQTVKYDDENFIKRIRPATKARTPEQIAATLRDRFKKLRAEKVANITVDVDGMVFDGDETSQQRMARSILVMNDTEQITWILSDNTPASVTKAQLELALRKAGEAQTQLWSQS